MFEPLNRRLFMKTAGSAVVALSTSFGTLRAAFAQQTALQIGLAAPPTTLDPHHQNNAPNNALGNHIFDALVTNDEQSQSKPGLASSWKVIDDLTWDFTLNTKAVFSDGTPFTAADAIASIERVARVPSVTPYTTYTRTITEMSEPEPGILRIRTSEPDPILLNSLSRIRIISAKHAQADSADFNSGAAAIGTGPFVLKEYVPGNRIVLARNDTYWGTPPTFESVTLHIITDQGARLASLLSGDLDLVEQVPFQGIERVESNPQFKIIRGQSSRVVFFGGDMHRDVTPFATDNNGKPLKSNPFKDIRVRRAFGMAINREAVIQRVMAGNAIIADQFMQPGGFGISDNIKPIPYDPQGAKALLAEAGYPDGFKLTIHGPNDRYVNDARIVQAAAQFLTRIGIQTVVDVMPWSVYSSRYSNADFSFYLGSWGVNTGETSNPLIALTVTRNPDDGTGASNNNRYSNPELDALVMKAKETLDDTERAKLLGQACEIVFNQHVIIPLHNEVSVTGAKKTVEYMPRNDQYTLAQNVTLGS